MRIKRGKLDGAQPLAHVIATLRKHGVVVTHIERDEYYIEGKDATVEVIDLLDPVVAEMVEHLWRRFRDGSWLITEFVYRPPRPMPH